MYKLREVNAMLQSEDLPTVSRQMLSLMRGLRRVVKHKSPKTGEFSERVYQTKMMLMENVHYVIKENAKSDRFMTTDEGYKRIKRWAIARKAKDQSKIQDTELAKWIQSNAKRLITGYSDKTGNIDFNRLESVEWSANFPKMPSYKFNRAVRQALSFVAS